MGITAFDPGTWALRARRQTIMSHRLNAQIFRSTAIYSAGTAVAKLAGFAMLPFYAHYFETEGYGVMALVDTSLGVLSIVVTGGFQVGMLRIFHESEGERKSASLTTGVVLVWAIAISLAVVPFMFSGMVSQFLFGDVQYSTIICLALATFVIDIAGRSASTDLIIRDKAFLFTIVSNGQMILALLLNIWLIVFLKIGLIGIFVSSFVSATIASLIFHGIALSNHGLRFDRGLARQILAFQLPMMPGHMVSFVGRQAERVLVRIQLGLGPMGVLEMAYRFPPMLNFLVTIPFSRAWQTKSFEIADDEGAPNEMGRMFSRFFLLISVVALLISTTIDGVLRTLTPPDFWPAARLTKIEVLTMVIVACTRFTSFGAYYAKRTSLFTYVHMVMTPIKIALAFLMISAFGLAGAALTALLIQVASFTWISLRAQRMYAINYDYRAILLVVAVSAGLFCAIEWELIPSYDILKATVGQFIGMLFDPENGLGQSVDSAAELFVRIQARLDPIAEAIVNGLLCLPLLILFPVLFREPKEE